MTQPSRESPFVVRQFEGTPWVPLHEAARLHDAVQSSGLTIAALRNQLADRDDGDDAILAAVAEARRDSAPHEPLREGLDVERLRSIVAIAQGRLDAVRAGRGEPIVFGRLADDLEDIAVALRAEDGAAGLSTDSGQRVSLPRSSRLPLSSLASTTQAPRSDHESTTPPTEELDVERLARALDTYWSRLGPMDPGMQKRNLAAAKAIAREYAALSEPHDKP